MRSLKIISLFIFCVFNSLSAQQQAVLTISVSAEGLDDTSKIFIAGNVEQLGKWNPALVSLDRDGRNQWSKSFAFFHNTILEFKFTKGSWETEAVDSKGNVPRNYHLTLTSDTTLEFTLTNWKDEFELAGSTRGQITGTVEYHPSIEYQGLLPRDIVIWLPPGYKSNLTERYPVLYMHDGQNIFDPSTSSFGIDWQIDEAADSLIRKGEIIPIIVVGIYNTINRTAEYSPTDTGYTYLKFVAEKLKPFIDSTYRTIPEREYTAVGGSSMGGLASFMFLWEYNHIFSKAICMSPAFKVSDESINLDYVREVISYPGKRKEIKVYIDIGGVGLEQMLQPGVEDMISILKEEGYKSGKDYLYVIDKDAEHFEAAWAKRIPGALKFLFAN
jgi:predicted alpha/beta superfamily hydrolase